ncbi:N-acyl amino acid synthase FeeM domain-containing protein [Mucisphaera calidilacus]|uniref:N-acyl amino acid synthase FeeM catalytic core domain-containing protein n=1 Tax=Mucisphaera calidilacus TaxID=2527982 RepID=A0A518BTN2_9BACT|nr:hypothetical protein [Mucisphaera calidilacus]QDU70319.1 hypothetical protein Pan265_01420 [Mucisphaera calidilacus]
MSEQESSTGAESFEPSANGSGLTFDVARDLAEVEECWSLVYRSYIKAGLIEPNAERVHTVPQTISPGTLVAYGRIHDVIVSTMTVYLDGPLGLPLDMVYKDELDQLRGEGRKLVELGLFADRRQHLYRSIDAILELMRYCTHYSVNEGHLDAVVGVNPRHVPFYVKLLGFEAIGETKTYETVNDFPVVLLHLDWPKKTAMKRLPKGLAHLHEPAISPDYYATRCVLTPERIAGTPVEKAVERKSVALSAM